MKDIKKYLWLSQISLLGFLLLCCLIRPSVVLTNGGVSNFGNHKSTIVFYVLAFSLSALALCVTATILLKKSYELRHMAYSLYVLALLEMLVLLTTFPRSISWTYSEIHDYLGIALFAYEFILAIWFVIKQPRYSTVIIFLIEFIGAMIGLLTVLKFFHLLFVGQAIGSLGFGLLLVTCFPNMIEHISEL